jgi:hypothetical protein
MLAAAADAIDGPVRVKAYKKWKKSNVWTTQSLNFHSQQACFSTYVVHHNQLI